MAWQVVLWCFENQCSGKARFLAAACVLVEFRSGCCRVASSSRSKLVEKTFLFLLLVFLFANASKSFLFCFCMERGIGFGAATFPWQAFIWCFARQCLQTQGNAAAKVLAAACECVVLCRFAGQRQQIVVERFCLLWPSFAPLSPFSLCCRPTSPFSPLSPRFRTECLAHTSFYPDKGFYTQVPLNTTAFTHRRSFFTHKRICTQEKTFTQR